MEDSIKALLDYKNHKVMDDYYFESHGFNFSVFDIKIAAITVSCENKIVAQIMPNYLVYMKPKHEQLVESIKKVIPQERLNRISRVIAAYFYIKNIQTDIIDASYIGQFHMFFDVNGFVIKNNMLTNFRDLEIKRIKSNHEFLDYNKEVEVLERYCFV